MTNCWTVAHLTRSRCSTSEQILHSTCLGCAPPLTAGPRRATNKGGTIERKYSTIAYSIKMNTTGSSSIRAELTQVSRPGCSHDRDTDVVEWCIQDICKIRMSSRPRRRTSKVPHACKMWKSEHSHDTEYSATSYLCASHAVHKLSTARKYTPKAKNAIRNTAPSREKQHSFDEGPSSVSEACRVFFHYTS